jgi:hypothetical protein
MKRPERKRPHRQKRLTDASVIDLAAVSANARYVGSREHKSGPSFAGQPAPRSDASICDASLNDRQTEIQNWLRAALQSGQVGAPIENGFPRYVWHIQDNAAYEARLTNRERGEYKGYPIDFDECPIHL